MTIKRIRQLGIASLAALFVVACGQKGPLRMPDDDESGKKAVNHEVASIEMQQKVVAR